MEVSHPYSQHLSCISWIWLKHKFLSVELADDEEEEDDLTFEQRAALTEVKAQKLKKRARERNELAAKE